MAARAYVGLGANLGDGPATLRKVLAEIALLPGITHCVTSPFYRSAPILASGPDFTNAVAALETTLEPFALLNTLQNLEQRHGRQRPYPNAPRTLDLDLLLYADRVINDPQLTLPHPRLHLRAFVLQPLHDLAPQLILSQGTLDQLLLTVANQHIERLPDSTAL